MRTMTVNVLKVNELSENAKQQAYHEWLGNSDYGWSEENRKTMEAFENIFPVNVTNWEYDSMRGHVSFEFTEGFEIEDMHGIRLAKYIYNNYWNQITAKKFYWDGRLNSKSRHSKFQIITPSTGACPLTGYYMDEEILDPIFDFLKKPSDDTNFYELMRECLDKWVKACVNDAHGCSTMEYFEEQAEANDWEFYEDGSMV